MFLCYFKTLEFSELLSVAGTSSNLDDVESNGLRDWSTLTSSDDVTNVDTESWGDVHWDVLVSLFVSVVLGHVVQVVSSHDDGTVHLGRDNDTTQKLTTDRDHTGEWALLVNVGTLNGGLWGLETQTSILIPSLSPLRGLDLWVVEDVRLLLESSFRLNGQLSGHLYGSLVPILLNLSLQNDQFLILIIHYQPRATICKTFGKFVVCPFPSAYSLRAWAETFRLPPTGFRLNFRLAHSLGEPILRLASLAFPPTLRLAIFLRLKENFKISEKIEIWCTDSCWKNSHLKN